MIFTLMVTATRSKVKSRSHHDITHLQPPSNVPRKCQLFTFYGFQDIAWTRFERSRSLQQSQILNQGHTMVLHTYITQPMSLPSIYFQHLTVSKIELGQDFIGQSNYGKVKGQIKVTPRHYIPITPSRCPYQVSTSYTLRFLRYRPDKLFLLPALTPAFPDTMGENKTLTPLNGCGVKKPKVGILLIANS